jgi:hypothetical protein
VHTIAEAAAWLACLDDHAAAVGVDDPNVQSTGDAGPVIDRDRRQSRVHVARDRVERIERDDIADLGAEFADLMDQADGAHHPCQHDRGDA